MRVTLEESSETVTSHTEAQLLEEQGKGLSGQSSLFRPAIPDIMTCEKGGIVVDIEYCQSYDIVKYNRGLMIAWRLLSLVKGSQGLQPARFACCELRQRMVSEP